MILEPLEVFGIIGSISGLISMLWPGISRRTKFCLALYGLCMTGLAIWLVVYSNKYSDLVRIEKEAQRLMSSQQVEDGSWGGAGNPNVSDKGYMLAVLAFLEKYKARFPNTHETANELCKTHGIVTPPKGSYTDQNDLRNASHEGAKAMRALLSGIAAGGLR